MTAQKIKILVCLSLLITLSQSYLSNTHATVIGSALDNNDGTVTYSYEVDNSLGNFDISVWSLEFKIIPDWDQVDTLGGGDVEVPNLDWFADVGIPNVGLAAQDFNSFDKIVMGDLLGGFSFTSSFAPGNVTYFEFGSSGESFVSTTVGPSVLAVPEPSTWALLVFGLIGLVLKRNAHKKQYRRPIPEAKYNKGPLAF